VVKVLGNRWGDAHFGSQRPWRVHIWGGCQAHLKINGGAQHRRSYLKVVDDNPPTSLFFLVTPPLQGLTPPNKFYILNYYIIATCLIVFNRVL